MEKKMWNKIFFKDFSNFNFRKKKRDWKMEKKKKKEEPNLLLIITLLFMSPTTEIFYTLCFW